MRYLIKGRKVKGGVWNNVSATFNDDSLDRAIERFKARFMPKDPQPGDRVEIEGAYIQVMGKGWRNDNAGRV